MSTLPRGVRQLESTPVVSGVATFTELGVPPHLVARMAKMHIHEPTPVQEAALKLLVQPVGSGHTSQHPTVRSAVVRWSTGSGKTLAYMLPLLANIKPLAYGVQAVIVLPTRELCLQTLKVLNHLTGFGHTNKKGNSVSIMSVMGRINVSTDQARLAILINATSPHTSRTIPVSSPRLGKDGERATTPPTLYSGRHAAAARRAAVLGHRAADQEPGGTHARPRRGNHVSVHQSLFMFHFPRREAI